MSTHKSTNSPTEHAPTFATRPYERVSSLRKLFVVGVALVLALGGAGSVLAGCGAAASSSTTSATSESQSGMTKAPEPTWTEQPSAEEAAKAAGLERFGAPRIEVAGLVFDNPTFSTAGKVAQATYKTNSSTLSLRKAGADATESTAAIRTHDLGVKWDQEVDDIKLIACGNSEGKAVTIQWADEGLDYGITLEGNRTMNADDVANAVCAVYDANTTSQQENGNGQEDGPNNAAIENDYISEEDAKTEAIQAVDNGLPNEAFVKLHNENGNAFYTVALTYSDVSKIVALDAKTGAVQSVTDEGRAEDISG